MPASAQDAGDAMVVSEKEKKPLTEKEKKAKALKIRMSKMSPLEIDRDVEARAAKFEQAIDARSAKHASALASRS